MRAMVIWPHLGLQWRPSRRFKVEKVEIGSWTGSPLGSNGSDVEPGVEGVAMASMIWRAG